MGATNAQYGDAIPPWCTANNGMFKAMRLAMRYTHRTPSKVELMAEYGMSRATALRWIRAMKDAKGQP